MLSEIELLTDEQVFKIYGVAPKTLANWRCQGVGPRFCKIGHHVRYRPDDLKAFIESRMFDSTSAYAASQGRTKKSRKK